MGEDRALDDAVNTGQAHVRLTGFESQADADDFAERLKTEFGRTPNIAAAVTQLDVSMRAGAEAVRDIGISIAATSTGIAALVRAVLFGLAELRRSRRFVYRGRSDETLVLDPTGPISDEALALIRRIAASGDPLQLTLDGASDQTDLLDAKEQA
jgi:hypothetical protein